MLDLEARGFIQAYSSAAWDLDACAWAGPAIGLSQSGSGALGLCDELPAHEGPGSSESDMAAKARAQDAERRTTRTHLVFH